jgi:hypothetical protein
MKVFAYINSAGKVIYHIEDNMPYPNGDEDWSYKRFPKADLVFEENNLQEDEE